MPTLNDTAYVASGGTVNVTAGTARCSWLELGNSGNSGELQMTGGSLTALTGEDVGIYGTGRFQQSGGVNTAGNVLNIGSSYISNGSYGLSGNGQLFAQDEYVGGSGNGTFAQSGGTNTASSSLWISYYSGTQGLYLLSGNGFLSASTLNVAVGDNTAGQFQQSGGTNQSDLISIGSGGQYRLSGGLLQVSRHFSNAGVFDGANSAGTLAVGGILDLTSGTWQNTGSLSLKMTGNSLLIYSASTSPQSLFGSFQTQGLTHVSGTTLNLLPGQAFSGAGTINDPISCQGTITVLSGNSVTLGNGLQVSGSGNVQLGSGSLVVNDSVSGINGGQIGAYSQYIGSGGTGTFTQSGGTNVVTGTLYLANNAGDSGSYFLSGNSQFSAQIANVGYAGTGAFVQTGGTSTFAGSLILGSAAGSSGSFALSGNGVVLANAEYLGIFGSPTGQFQQTGGSNTVGLLSIGSQAQYRLGGGVLQVTGNMSNSGVFDGANSAGTLNVAGLLDLTSGVWQNTKSMSVNASANSLTLLPAGMSPTSLFGSYQSLGITHVTGTPLNVPAGQGFSGRGTIKDFVNCQGMIAGDSNGINLQSGLSLSGTGSVLLGNGGLTVTGSASGISGGQLAAQNEWINSTFAQSGGTNTVNSLNLGNSNGTFATYNLLGNGRLSVSNEYIASGGTGSFVQSGGVHAISNALYLGYNWSTSGSYVLSGSGYLSAANEYLGYSGTGSFTQSGGTNVVAGTLYLGCSIRPANYTLSGSGVVLAGTEQIGTLYGGYTSNAFVFQQTGGTNSAATVNIGNRGRYTLAGGVLQVAGNLSNSGTFDGAASVGSIYASGILDLTSGYWKNLGTTSLTMAADSLLILPPGTTPRSIFGSYQSLGLTYVTGTPLNILPGQGFRGQGSIFDFVNCQGTISASATDYIMLSNGLLVSGIGNVNLGGGTTIVNDSVSGITGGQLSANALQIGYNGKGTFKQSAGTTTLSYLGLGQLSGDVGTYLLNGNSQLSANIAFVGESGTGSFTQSGGTTSFSSSLNLGCTSGGSGTYCLNNNGVLSGSAVYVGYDPGATARFQQMGGTNNAGFLSIGPGGTYQFQGGSIQAMQGLTIAGLFDGMNTSGSIATGGLVDLSNGTLQNMQSVTMSVAGNSLVIVPAGFNPSTTFASFQSLALMHTAGTTLTISAGQSLNGQGSIRDLVLCQGSINSTSGGINLNGGLVLSGSGSVQLGSGNLTVNSAESAMSGGQLTVASQYVGRGGTGTFAQSGGSNSFSALYLGYGSADIGTYTLSGTGVIPRSNTYVGYSGTGSFTQSAGTSGTSGWYGLSLYVGYNSGSHGTYTLSGGQLLTSQVYVGSSGTAAMIQSGGTNTISSYVYLGDNSGSCGSYTLSGSGQMSVPSAYIGYNGAGTFTQSGGSNTIGSLYLGFNSGGQGSYELTGNGQVAVSSACIGNSGTGVFAQSGGTATVSGSLTIGNLSGSGTYTLNGGLLSAPNENVGWPNGGLALFQQSGGTNDTATLYISNSGRYVLGGGIVQVTNYLTNDGIFDGANSSGTLSASGILNLTSGTWQNLGSLSVNMSANSLLILPAGTSTGSVFGHYSSLGLTHVAGTTLVVPSGQSIVGLTTITDFVDCQGTLAASSGGLMTMSGGASVSGTGSLQLGYGNLTVNNSASGISGGQLNAGYEYIGSHGIGTFTQSGGRNTMQYSLNLGNASGDRGVYNLSSNGVVSAVQEYVGYNSAASGLFQQSGGTNSTSLLSISSSGQYRFGGGVLQATGNLSNAGLFDGLNTAGTMSVGGILDLTSGTWQNMSSTSVHVGANSLVIVPVGFNPVTAFGAYQSLGLTHTVGSTLTLLPGQSINGQGNIADLVDCQGTIVAMAGGGINLAGGLILSDSGSVQLNSGNLTVNNLVSTMTGGQLTGNIQYVGNGGNGSFTQSCGTSTLTSQYLGYATANSGSYTLSGNSNLQVASSLFVGYSGKGTFSQTGGTNTVVGLLILGSNSSSSGTYSLTGDGLLSTGTADVGYSGTGTLNQSAGTLLTSSMYLGYRAPGLYNLSGNGQLISTNEYIGQSIPPTGSGVFTQSGGTNTVANGLSISSLGTYNFSNGLLVVGGLSKSGTGALNIGSGTLQANRAFSSYAPLQLTSTGGNATIDTAGYSVTLSGAIFGPGNLVKSDSGLLILNGANTYSGGTVINGGLLQFTSASSVPSGAGGIMIGPNGALLANGAYSSVAAWLASGKLSGASSGAIALTGDSSENINMAGFRSLSLGVSSGMFANYSGTLMPAGNTYYLGGGGGTLSINNVNAINGVASNLVVANGTVLLTAANNYGGATTVTSGVLGFSTDNNLGSGSLNLVGGTLQTNGAMPLSSTRAITLSADSTIQTLNSAGTTFSGVLSGGYGLAKTGSGALFLAGSNTYAGSTTICDGTLSVGTDSSLGAGGMTLGGGTLQTIGSTPFISTKPITLAGASDIDTPNTAGTTLLGAISGPQGFVKTGPGSLYLAGTNSYSGNTTVSGGVLSVSADTALGGGALILNGGTLQTTGNAAFTSARAIQLNANCSVVTNNSAGTSFSGPLSGFGQLTKSGPGLLTLNGGIAFMGTVAVNQGILAAGGNGLGSGPVIVSSGGTLSVAAGRGHSSGLVGQYFDYPWNSMMNPNSNFATLSALNGYLAGLTPSVTALANQATFDFGDSRTAVGTSFPTPYNNNVSQWFEARWTGKFLAPVAGMYVFDTTSDDGSCIWLDGNETPVVNNNYWQPAQTRSGSTYLSAGLHDIVIGYYQGPGDYSLSADVQIPGGSLERLPTSLLLSGSETSTNTLFVAALSGDGVVDLSGRTMVVGASGMSSSFAGTITGNGKLTKDGPGTLALSGTSTFSGEVIVDGGTLCLTAASALPDGMSLAVGSDSETIFGGPTGGDQITSLATLPLSPVPEPGTLVLFLVTLLSAAVYCRFCRRL